MFIFPHTKKATNIPNVSLARNEDKRKDSENVTPQNNSHKLSIKPRHILGATQKNKNTLFSLKIHKNREWRQFRLFLLSLRVHVKSAIIEFNKTSENDKLFLV